MSSWPLDCTRLEDILEGILGIGNAADIESRTEQFAEDLTSRIGVVPARVTKTQAPKRVPCIEWAKPLRAAGLWTSDNVPLAGGVPGLTPLGERSRKIGWDEAADFSPDIALFTRCGYDIPRSFRELATVAADPQWASLPAIRADEAYVFDGRVPSRHGPRAIDLLEAFAEIFHPRHFTPRWQGALYQRTS